MLVYRTTAEYCRGHSKAYILSSLTSLLYRHYVDWVLPHQFIYSSWSIRLVFPIPNVTSIFRLLGRDSLFLAVFQCLLRGFLLTAYLKVLGLFCRGCHTLAKGVSVLRSRKFTFRSVHFQPDLSVYRPYPVGLVSIFWWHQFAPIYGLTGHFELFLRTFCKRTEIPTNVKVSQIMSWYNLVSQPLLLIFTFTWLVFLFCFMYWNSFLLFLFFYLFWYLCQFLVFIS